MRHPVIENDLAAIASSALPWEALKGKTILISGANGFLPAYMTETLLYLNETRALGIHILGLVRDIDRAKARFANYDGRKDLDFLVQDVTQPLPPGLEAQFIIHAAGQASPKYYGVDPVGTLASATLGTAQLLELARRSRAEGFLFFSSGEVYGQVPATDSPLSEDALGKVDSMQLRSCYAEGKRAGETMCVAWNQQYGVPAVVARPFHTYGPGMRLDDGRVFADFVADLVACRDIVMKSDGSALRPFCYLADAVEGFFTVLLKGRPGQAYNIGNEDAEISILQLAERLVALFPKAGLKVVYKERDPGTYIASNFSRACPSTAKARGLGWAPRTGIEEGFLRTVRSYQ